MKKSLLILFMFLVLLSFVAAENETNSTELNATSFCESNNQCDITEYCVTETGLCEQIQARELPTEVTIPTEELRIFTTPLGQEIRFLQLTKKIIEHVYTGNEVLNNIEDEQVREEALLILEELSLLAEEIQTFSDKETSAEESARQYILFRHEAQELTTQFRELIRSSITEDERETIRTLLERTNKDDLLAINEEVRLLIAQHNADRMQAHLNELDIQDEEFIQLIARGEARVADIKDRMKLNYAQGLPEAQNQTRLRAKKLQMQRESFILNLGEITFTPNRDRQEFLEERREEIRSNEWTKESTVARTHATNDVYKLQNRQRGNTQ